MIVHYMRLGMTACGMPAVGQDKWPDDERWVSPGYEHDVTGCEPCMTEARRIITDCQIHKPKDVLRKRQR